MLVVCHSHHSQATLTHMGNARILYYTVTLSLMIPNDSIILESLQHYHHFEDEQTRAAISRSLLRTILLNLVSPLDFIEDDPPVPPPSLYASSRTIHQCRHSKTSYLSRRCCRVRNYRHHRILWTKWRSLFQTLGRAALGALAGATAVVIISFWFLGGVGFSHGSRGRRVLLGWGDEE